MSDRQMSNGEMAWNAFLLIVIGGMCGAAAVIKSDEWRTDALLDDTSIAQARQARVTAETSCTEQEKMFKKLGQYFDQLSADTAGDIKSAAKNPDFTITKAECLKLMQERQQKAAVPKP